MHVHITHTHIRKRVRGRRKCVCAVFIRYERAHTHIYVHILSCLRSVHACGRDMFYITCIKSKKCASRVVCVHMYILYKFIFVSSKTYGQVLTYVDLSKDNQKRKRKKTDRISPVLLILTVPSILSVFFLFII